MNAISTVTMILLTILVEHTDMAAMKNGLARNANTLCGIQGKDDEKDPWF